MKHTKTMTMQRVYKKKKRVRLAEPEGGARAPTGRMALQLIVLVGELPGRDEAILVLVLFGENVLHHVLVQRVVGRVAVALKLLPQVLPHLGHGMEVSSDRRKGGGREEFFEKNRPVSSFLFKIRASKCLPEAVSFVNKV